MHIAFIEPLSRAWGRMKKALFQPFDLTKWFVVGFTAFLAGLLDCHGRNGYSRPGGGDQWDASGIVDFPYTAWEWLMDNPGWFALILFVSFLFFIFIIVLAWLSSRGKFMFLDNVVHDRARVVMPWREYRSLGNALFLWRLGYGLIIFLVFIGLLIFAYFNFVNLYELDFPRVTTIWTAIGMVLLFFAIIIITGYISLLLNDFVVPIMYKNNIKTCKAWRRFLSLFSRHILYFIGYGLFIVLLTIVVVFCVIFFGLFTCCLGFILLIIPYIGSVVTLPIAYTFRAFSVEFLEQFGPEYKIFPEESGISAENAGA